MERPHEAMISSISRDTRSSTSHVLSNHRENSNKKLKNIHLDLKRIADHQKATKWKCDECWCLVNINMATCLACGTSRSLLGGAFGGVPATVATWIANIKYGRRSIRTRVFTEEQKCFNIFVDATAQVSSLVSDFRGNDGILLIIQGFCVSPSLGSLFSNQTDQWRCHSCAILSDKNILECPACLTERGNWHWFRLYP